MPRGIHRRGRRPREPTGDRRRSRELHYVCATIDDSRPTFTATFASFRLHQRIAKTTQPLATQKTSLLRGFPRSQSRTIRHRRLHDDILEQPTTAREPAKTPRDSHTRNHSGTNEHAMLNLLRRVLVGGRKRSQAALQSSLSREYRKTFFCAAITILLLPSKRLTCS